MKTNVLNERNYYSDSEQLKLFTYTRFCAIKKNHTLLLNVKNITYFLYFPFILKPDTNLENFF